MSGSSTSSTASFARKTRILPVSASIEEIVHTLFEAILLVVLVVFVFLQNFRATLIPLVAIPVSLIGTFAFFPALGFTVNTLTMFGLVLAIGIVVDDAIVVVEAVEAKMEENPNISPKEAARKANPALLEPIMAVEVTTPEDYMGDVIGDLNSRRGQIQAMEERSGARVVKALVPLSEMFGYVGDLRSKTQGRANYSMVFDSYAEVPANVSKEIIAKATGQ